MTNVDTNIFFYEGTHLTLILTMLLTSSKCWIFFIDNIFVMFGGRVNGSPMSTKCAFSIDKLFLFICMRQTSCPTHIVLCFVSFFVFVYVASFSGLSIFDCPFEFL